MNTQTTIKEVESHVKNMNSNKPVVTSGKLRNTVYGVSDNLLELSDCAKDLNDEYLRNDVYMLMQKFDEVYDHLTKHYNWD
mgnify:CR=1 FL=1